jgi:homoserine kinase
MVKVTVPATTANIGPGFDTLGLALNIYNVYEFEEIDEGLVINGCPDKYRNENNLIYKYQEDWGAALHVLWEEFLVQILC